MTEINYIVVLVIYTLIASFATLFLATIVGKVISKANLFLIKRHIHIAAKNENPEELSDELVKLSIIKLRSQDPERKKLGLMELQYGWLESESTKKHLIINELIDILYNEHDIKFRKEIILILYKLIISDSDRDPKIG
jgi:hypothetical protein